MLEFLKYKKSSFKDPGDMQYGLVFDEMSITEMEPFNSSTGAPIGNITFPGHTGTANKALVFMLVGIRQRWKHIVGYHFTGNSIDGNNLKSIIFQIISETEKIGFYVNFITCDMGSANISLWRSLHINSGRFTAIQNRIVHPCDSTRRLYVIGDVPHILKNLKQALINNGNITICDSIVAKYELPSSTIEIEHIKELIEIQDDYELLLTPKLRINDLRGNNFDKMKMNKAKNIFSQDVSSLKLIALEKNKLNFLTTAWFVELIFKWFTLMSSRNYKVALDNNNNKFEESINFLYDVIDIFSNLKIGDGKFRPVQRGIMISITSIIELTQYLTYYKNFKYVFTARFTQDCVENLFSQIRKKNVPNPLTIYTGLENYKYSNIYERCEKQLIRY